jgi:hypothetical protein
MAQCAGCGGNLQVYTRSHGKQRAHCYACPRAKVDRCANTLEAPMSAANATALAMMTTDVLAPDVIELALSKLMRKFDEPTENVEARRAQLTTSLRKTEKELTNLARAVTAAEDAPETLVAAVRERERTKKQIVADLAALDATVDVVGAAPEIQREAQELLKEWRGLLAKHIAVSRQALRKLLDRGRFTFYPMGEGENRWYELGVTPSLDRFFCSLPALKKPSRPQRDWSIRGQWKLAEKWPESFDRPDN